MKYRACYVIVIYEENSRFYPYLYDAGFSNGWCSKKYNLDPINRLWTNFNRTLLWTAFSTIVWSRTCILTTLQKIQVQLCTRQKRKSNYVGICEREIQLKIVSFKQSQLIGFRCVTFCKINRCYVPWNISRLGENTQAKTKWKYAVVLLIYCGSFRFKTLFYGANKQNDRAKDTLCNFYFICELIIKTKTNLNSF